MGGVRTSTSTTVNIHNPYSDLNSYPYHGMISTCDATNFISVMINQNSTYIKLLSLEIVSFDRFFCQNRSLVIRRSYKICIFLNNAIDTSDAYFSILLATFVFAIDGILICNTLAKNVEVASLVFGIIYASL